MLHSNMKKKTVVLWCSKGVVVGELDGGEIPCHCRIVQNEVLLQYHGVGDTNWTLDMHIIFAEDIKFITTQIS